MTSRDISSDITKLVPNFTFCPSKKFQNLQKHIKTCNMTLKHDIYRFWADFGPSGAFGAEENFLVMSPPRGGPIPNFGLKNGTFPN